MWSYWLHKQYQIRLPASRHKGGAWQQQRLEPGLIWEFWLKNGDPMLITFLKAWKLGWTRLSCATISYAASHFLCVSHSALPSNSVLRWSYTLAKKTAARLMTPFHSRSLLSSLKKGPDHSVLAAPRSPGARFNPVTDSRHCDVAHKNRISHHSKLLSRREVNSGPKGK